MPNFGQILCNDIIKLTPNSGHSRDYENTILHFILTQYMRKDHLCRNKQKYTKFFRNN